VNGVRSIGQFILLSSRTQAVKTIVLISTADLSNCLDEFLSITTGHLHVREQEVHVAVKSLRDGDSFADAPGRVDLIPSHPQHALGDRSTAGSSSTPESVLAHSSALQNRIALGTGSSAVDF